MKRHALLFVLVALLMGIFTVPVSAKTSEEGRYFYQPAPCSDWESFVTKLDGIGGFVNRDRTTVSVIAQLNELTAWGGYLGGGQLSNFAELEVLAQQRGAQTSYTQSGNLQMDFNKDTFNPCNPPPSGGTGTASSIDPYLFFAISAGILFGVIIGIVICRRRSNSN